MEQFPDEIDTAKFGVVCLAGSAGGLEAYREILLNLRSDTGMAFVIVSHRSRQNSDLLRSILSSATRMPVVEVENGMRLEPNRVFVSPPHMEITTDGVGLYLQLRPEPRGWPVLITNFLSSVAGICGSRPVVVIVSGMGHDGCAALPAIKAGGGVVFAQSGARYESMPDHAIATGKVDLILSSSEIGKQLSLGRGRLLEVYLPEEL